MNKLGKKKEINLKKESIALVIKICVIVLLFVILFVFIFGLKRMDNLNMYPNIKQGDLLMYYRLDHTYDVGDVVIVKKEGKKNVYRIVAKEGEKVSVKEDRIYVNNLVEITESFYKTEKADESNVTYPYTVETGKYFVVNDYRLKKNDSRSFGTVSGSEIIGKVIGKIQVRNI